METNNTLTPTETIDAFIAAIDTFIASLPKIEKADPAKARAAAAVPLPFMASAFSQVEQSEEARKYIAIDVGAGQALLDSHGEYGRAFERLLKAEAALKANLDAQRTELAFQSLEIYAAIRRLARKRRGGKVEFQLMQKELRRKRRAKPDDETPTPAPVNPGTAPPLTQPPHTK